MKRTIDPRTPIPGGGLTRRDLGLAVAGAAAAALVSPVLADTAAEAESRYQVVLTAGNTADLYDPLSFLPFRPRCEAQAFLGGGLP